MHASSASILHTTTPSARRNVVEIGRALAVILMVQRHALRALLASGYPAGPVAGGWLYVRGQTSQLRSTHHRTGRAASRHHD